MLDADLIERILDDEPPALPPILGGGDRRPRREVRIMPDFTMAECRTKTRHDNCWTLHYVWMVRFEGFFEKLQVAHVNSRVYRRWLETYPMPDGIPPHIAFGGAVEAGKPDPDFYNKWKAYARRTFA